MRVSLLFSPLPQRALTLARRLGTLTHLTPSSSPSRNTWVPSPSCGRLPLTASLKSVQPAGRHRFWCHVRVAPLVGANQACACLRSGALAGATWPCAWLRPCAGHASTSTVSCESVQPPNSPTPPLLASNARGSSLADVPPFWPFLLPTHPLLASNARGSSLADAPLLLSRRCPPSSPAFEVQMRGSSLPNASPSRLNASPSLLQMQGGLLASTPTLLASNARGSSCPDASPPHPDASPSLLQTQGGLLAQTPLLAPNAKVLYSRSGSLPRQPALGVRVGGGLANADPYPYPSQPVTLTRAGHTTPAHHYQMSLSTVERGVSVRFPEDLSAALELGFQVVRLSGFALSNLLALPAL
jgi:hypothetical protein